MATYLFKCANQTEFEKDYSFKEFDQIKAGTLKVICLSCGSCNPEMIIGTGISVYDMTPRTLGSLADRNTKYRLPEYEEAEDKKRETRKAAGKYVPPKEITTPWERPEIKIDKQERKAKRDEFLAKSKSRKRSTRSNNKNNGNGK